MAAVGVTESSRAGAGGVMAISPESTLSQESLTDSGAPGKLREID